MRHAHHHLLDAERAALLDHRREDRDQRVGAFERETLRGRVAELEELLEALGGDQRVEHPGALLRRQLGIVRGRLHALLQPDALGSILELHVLDADRAAVRFAKPRDQLVQRRARAAAKAAALDDPVEVGRRETELRRLEQRVAGRRGRERVQVCDEVPELAIGVDEIEDAEDRLGIGSGCSAGRGGARPIAVDRELESGEKQRPPLVDRGGVGQGIGDIARRRTRHSRG